MKMKLWSSLCRACLIALSVVGGSNIVSMTTIANEWTPKYTDAFDMRYGLFIHWVACAPEQGTGLVHSDGRSIGMGQIDKYAESIDVEKVADEIKDLGFEYLILTDFHGRGTMLHPAGASDKWRGKGYASKRDVIGEMITALKKRGCGFILFTHPLAGHSYTEEQREMLGWNDPAGGYKRWNDFINDIYAELAQRYGNDMMGMGFDSEFGLSSNENFRGKLDLKRLRRTILSKAPNLQLYGLAAPNETCEFGHKEVWRPSWLDPWRSRAEDDYDVETWPSYRRVVSAVQPNHWATIAPPEKGITHLTADQLYRYTVLQAATATAGPGSAWAASPYADGSWEKGVREVFAQVAQYMTPVRKSLTRVYPSTSYPTAEGSQLAKLPHGTVATKATDDTVEYIHVLNPPATKTLSLPLPKDGKNFTSAKLLHSGRAVGLTRNADGLELVLSDEDEWDKLNTVIALDVDRRTIPRRNLALHKRVFTSSTVDHEPKWPPKSDFGRIRVNDGERHVRPKPEEWSRNNFGWTSERTETNRPQWLEVDLGEAQPISEVHLYPRDDLGNAGLGFPIDFKIDVSLDRKTWQTVASNRACPMTKDVWIEKFAPVNAQRIRVVATTLRQDPEDKLYSMQIVELEVYGDED